MKEEKVKKGKSKVKIWQPAGIFCDKCKTELEYSRELLVAAQETVMRCPKCYYLANLK